MRSAPEIFWDTCVFCAHFYDEREQYGDTIDHIRQYLREASEGKWRIITSSVVFAEIAFSKVKKGAPGSIEDVVRDIESSCIIIEPNPNIMLLAGKLRDLPYKKNGSSVRKLSVPDAVMLATAIYGRSYFSDFRAFHTFDAGGQKRAIPILGYEDWLDGFSAPKRNLASQVVDLPRMKPNHESPELPALS